MVVWEDRGVLKPPKPPIVHATVKGYLRMTTMHTPATQHQLTLHIFMWDHDKVRYFCLGPMLSSVVHVWPARSS